MTHNQLYNGECDGSTKGKEVLNDNNNNNNNNANTNNIYILPRTNFLDTLKNGTRSPWVLFPKRLPSTYIFTAPTCTD